MTSENLKLIVTICDGEIIDIKVKDLSDIIVTWEVEEELDDDEYLEESMMEVEYFEELMMEDEDLEWDDIY